MIWHIFKKDFRLLRHFVAGVTAITWLTTILIYRIDHGAANLRPLENLLIILQYLASGILVASLVQLDALPGVRQDWLVRPIRRSDLLLAKLFFVVMLVQGPIFVADLAEALAVGFPAGQALGTSLVRSICFLALLYVPILALGSVTRNFTEAVIGVVAAVILFALAMQFVNSSFPNTWRLYSVAGVDWLPQLAALLVGTLGVAAILALQYFRRRTMTSRWLVAALSVVCLVVNFAPLQPVFAIQQRWSPSPGAGAPVHLEFQPGLGRARIEMGTNEVLFYRVVRRREEGVAIYLPINVAGLPADSVLRTDWVTARLIAPGGKANDLGPGSMPILLNEAPNENARPTRAVIFVRDFQYAALKDQPIQVELDYSLTLLRLSSANAMPAVDGKQNVPALGHCETRVNSADTAVQLRCLQAGDIPPCTTFLLEHVPTGARNPQIVECDGQYTPFFMRFAPDGLTRTDSHMTFRDPSDAWHLPVDGPLLAQSHVVMRFYQPAEHFTRHVVIQDVRLRDWLPRRRAE